MSADELDAEVEALLARTPVRVVLQAFDASPRLVRMSEDPAFSAMNAALAFEYLDRGLRPPLLGLNRTDHAKLEISLNAYALRARLRWIKTGSFPADEGANDVHAQPPVRLKTTEEAEGGPGEALSTTGRARSGSSDGGEPPTCEPTPDEALATTTLRRLLLESAGGEGVRKRLGREFRSPLFEMSAAEFLADDEGERRFSGILDTRGYLRLSDLVSAYALVLHQETSRAAR